METLFNNYVDKTYEHHDLYSSIELFGIETCFLIAEIIKASPKLEISPEYLNGLIIVTKSFHHHFKDLEIEDEDLEKLEVAINYWEEKDADIFRFLCDYFWIGEDDDNIEY